MEQDGHAAMGDREVAGSGLETSMDVDFSFEVIPGDSRGQDGVIVTFSDGTVAGDVIRFAEGDRAGSVRLEVVRLWRRCRMGRGPFLCTYPDQTR